MRFSFGEFEFNVGRMELKRGETPLHLSPKAFALLEFLLRAAPDAVTKDELYAALWGEIFVDDANISNLVSEVRTALGEDSRNPRFIRTLYRVGYRFDGEVRSSRDSSEGPAARRAWLVWTSEEFPLGTGENIIGRDPEADVCLDSARISRRHARLTLTDRALLEDLGSKNGTWIGESRIDGPVEIRDGDTFALGSLRLTFRTVAEPETTLTEVELR